MADTIELVNGNDCCVDKATYSNYGVPWRSWERNDPRVREFAGYMPGGSPWCQNWYFMPDVGEIRNNEVGSSFYVRNGPFVSVGDIGYIHKGAQWRTLSLDKGGDWSLLDALTTSWPVEERVFGRININTAKRQVLESLPGIDSRLAEQIVRYGDTDSAPFDTPGEIAEVIGMQALGSNMWDDDGDGYVDEDDEVEALVRMVSNLITVRSNCFTVTTTGRVCRGNSIVAESKLEAVLDRGSSPLRTLYYRIVYENG